MDKTVAANHDEYISRQTEEIQVILKKIRGMIHDRFPDAEESIRYGMPAFKIGKWHAYFAANKKHLGMYPVYGIAELEKEYEPYKGKNTKDSLHFQYNKPIPYELIEKIIRYKSANAK